PRGVYFCKTPLLGPVAASRQYDRAAKVRDEFRQIGNQLVHTGEPHHGIAVAGDVERGHGYPRSGKGGEEFPVAINVAVIVEAAAKSGAGEFIGVEMDI